MRPFFSHPKLKEQPDPEAVAAAEKREAQKTEYEKVERHPRDKGQVQERSFRLVRRLETWRSKIKAKDMHAFGKAAHINTQGQMQSLNACCSN